jgi:hypothetical protein
VSIRVSASGPLEFVRSQFGPEVELLHDVHERVPPILALQLAKDLEPYKLFFLEDVFALEDNGYLRMLPSQSPTPIAMGELYVNQHEYVPLISDRLLARCGRTNAPALGSTWMSGSQPAFLSPSTRSREVARDPSK